MEIRFGVILRRQRLREVSGSLGPAPSKTFREPGQVPSPLCPRSTDWKVF